MSDSLSIGTQSGFQAETYKDFGDGDEALWSYWMGQDKIAEKEEDKWRRRGDRVIQRYRDERPDGPSRAVHKFNILWSNVQTLAPVLYARTPKPVVQRRFLDKDPVGRLASTLLERAIAYSLDRSDFDSVMNPVVLDRLLPGRGVARVMYVPHYSAEPGENFKPLEQGPALIAGPGDAMTGLGPEGANAFGGLTGLSASGGIAGMSGGPSGGAPAFMRDDLTPMQPAGAAEQDEPEMPVYEEAALKYVFWGDYRESPARTWDEVSWLRYAAYMTRDELIARFGRQKGKKVNLDYTPKGHDTSRKQEWPPPDVYKKAIVYEFWDKSKRKVVWLAPGTPNLILDELDDPLGLPDFFPSPDPLLATTTTDKRVPVPDYTEYQDQADELDMLTARIDRLARALKVSGVYPGSEKHVLQQLVDDGTENKLIPVEDWMSFAQKGGLSDMIQWMPIKQVAEVLIQLQDMRDRCKQIIYEITGIGDIIRGATQPMETAAAQKLKASFSTRRQVPEQKRVARFARDLVRLVGAVVAEHFSPATISAITGYPELQPVPDLQPPPPREIPAPPQPMGQPPQGGNVVPGPGMQPGMQPPGMPQMMPNPAYEQWEKIAQARAQVIAMNSAKQKMFDDAVALIKKDGVTGFRLDIETDSTIAVDEEQDRADRTQFIGSLLPLMQQIVPVAMGNPAMAEFGKQLVLFGVRGFPIARSMEESIEQLFDSLSGMPPTPPKGPQAKPGPDPQIEQAKIQADMHDTDQKAQTERMAIWQKHQKAQEDAMIARERINAEQQRNMTQLAIQASEADAQRAVQAQRSVTRSAGDIE